MQLEEYFDFLAPNDIRLKGHRIGIETILLDYIELGLFPEDIVLRYPSLSLEQVYATITYYYRNQAKIDAYLRGQSFAAPGEDGWALVCVDSHPLGWGKRVAGVLKSHYPRGLRWV